MTIKHWHILSIEDLPGEIWKPIIGFDCYVVSNFSRIKSLSRLVKHPFNTQRLIPTRILKQHPNSHGYLSVHLSGSRRGSYATHILVANAFIQNPLNLPQIAHINHDRGDPSLSNLMWVTGAENMQQSVVAGRVSRGECRPASVLTEYEASVIYETNMSYRKLAHIFGVCFSTVQELKSGKNWAYLTKNLVKNGKNKLPEGLGVSR